MRFILKLVAAPVALALIIVTAFFSFLLSVSDVFFGIASGLVFVAAVILLITGYTDGGIAFLVIAFLISPYGLLKLARWIVRKLDGLGSCLKGFILG